jgi:hypothetical protein
MSSSGTPVAPPWPAQPWRCSWTKSALARARSPPFGRLAGRRPRDGLRPRRLVRAVAQRRGCDRLPRTGRARPSRADAGQARLWRPAARPPRRGQSEGDLNAARTASRTCARPSPTCARARMCAAAASAASACRSAVSCFRPRRTTLACGPWGAGLRSAAAHKHIPNTPPDRSGGSRRSRWRRRPASSSIRLALVELAANEDACVSLSRAPKHHRRRDGQDRDRCHVGHARPSVGCPADCEDHQRAGRQQGGIAQPRGKRSASLPHLSGQAFATRTGS